MFGKKYATIRKLANRNIIEHKFRHALNIIVVMCLTIFISAFEIVSSSTYSNVEEDYLKQNGNASQIQTFDVPLESFENFKMDNIEEIGQSVYIGNAVNDEFRNRPSELRYADSNYAEYMFSLPIQGRMPENKNEIAVDRSVLEDLEKDATLGTDITIYWLDEDKKEQSQTFEVVGIWEENSLYTTRNLWVSKDFIKKMNTNIDLAFNLKSGKVNNKTLDEVAEKLQIEEEQVISNWVYEDNVQKQIRLETLVYKIGASFILLCGFLILYNIIAISIASDRKLYGRIKTLGASPKQVKLSVFYQYFFDVLIGIPLGLALGYILGSKMVPVVITSLSIMVLVIGIVNFANVIIISVTSRKKEFAMMQSIGMTKKQLRLLLMMEGINISIITLIISYFLSLVTICVGVSAYLQTQWTATYHFSITPLLIVTPVLIILPIVISLICFQRIQKIEIIERLQDEDEVGTV